MFIADSIVTGDVIGDVENKIKYQNHQIIRVLPLTAYISEVTISSSDSIYKVVMSRRNAAELREVNYRVLADSPKIEGEETLERFKDKSFILNWNHYFDIGIAILDSTRYIVKDKELYNKLKEMKLQTSNVFHSPLVINHTTRFSGAAWFNTMRSLYITIIGAGGIGSFTAFYLSRMSRYVTVYDPDIVDETNLGGQLYSIQDLGMNKVEALLNIVNKFGGHINRVRPVPFNYNQSLDDTIVIGAVDNMEVRKTIFNKFLDSDTCKLLIDGRLTADELQVFVVDKQNPTAIEEYRNKWLFDDKEAAETLCSFKQTTYMAGMIASIITNVVVNYVACMADLIPFFIHYDANLFKFELQ